MASDRKFRRQPSRADVPEHIDPELTPPPVSIEEIQGFDSIPPPIQEQLRMLRAGLDRSLSARQHGEWLVRIESNLATLARSCTQSETILEEYVKPQLDHWRATTDQIARDMPKMLAALEGVTLTVQAIDHRLRDLEVRMSTSAARADAQHAAIDLRVAEAEAVHRRHELRLKEMETKHLTAEATEQALAKQSRKSGGASGGIVAAIVSALAALASHLAK